MSPSRAEYEPVITADQAPQGQHAQADREGVILIGARHVEMRARRQQGLDQMLGRGLQLQFAETPVGVAQQRRRDQRHRQHGHDLADRLHQMRDQRLDRVVTRLGGQVPEIDAARRTWARIEIGVPKLTQA